MKNQLDEFLSLNFYEPLYEGLTLQWAGVILGFVLIAAHVFALMQRAKITPFLKSFPRNKAWGIGLLVAAAVWCWALMASIDMGEFFVLRKVIQFAIPVAVFLVISHVGEFLSVRAAGILLILAAGPVLGAAFLEPPVTRLLLPILAYVWIFVGMFMIGMPYLLRDGIGWLLSGGEQRWKVVCLAGAVYGGLVMLCAGVFWGAAS